IASRGTTQSATDSPRRPYCSCAYASAKAASGAATEPACSNACPLRSWRKTSQITSGCFGEDRLPHPGRLVARDPAKLEPLGRPRPVTGHAGAQLLPVRLGVLPAPLVAPTQLWIGNGQAELPDLRDVPLEELLPRLLVALRLDPPLDDRVVFSGNWVA